MIPEIWLKSRIKKIKSVIVKELPDAIDLLGLCVNAGLDFMLSLNTDSNQTSIVTPFPGTRLYELAKEKGWLVTDDWRLFDGRHAVLSYLGYSNKDIEKMFAEMILKWERHLALHKPGAIFNHLYGIYRHEGLLETLRAIVWGLKRLAGVY